MLGLIQTTKFKKMKKIFLIVGIFIVFCLIFAYGAAKIYLRPMEYMSLKKVCKRWGEQPFDESKFKSAGENRAMRAKMTCSLLKNQQKYIGLDSLEIRKRLGDYSGYFFSESFPAYIINQTTKKDKNIWQILFFVDEDHKVSEIVVHKNCCY